MVCVCLGCVCARCVVLCVPLVQTRASFEETTPPQTACNSLRPRVDHSQPQPPKLSLYTLAVLSSEQLKMTPIGFRIHLIRDLTYMADENVKYNRCTDAVFYQILCGSCAIYFARPFTLAFVYSPHPHQTDRVCLITLLC